MSIYDYSVKNRNGEDVSIANFKGKVLIIVNTATGCGFTPQYEGLETLYKKYHDQGLEILDFPCNQFGSQAPGSDDEIHEFCTFKYNTTFDQFSKIDVNGENESPLFTYIKNKKTKDITKGIKNKIAMNTIKKISKTTINKNVVENKESLYKLFTKDTEFIGQTIKGTESDSVVFEIPDIDYYDSLLDGKVEYVSDTSDLAIISFETNEDLPVRTHK